MLSKRRRLKRMYAVSAKGIGLIAGTVAYSRREAIKHFLEGSRHDWSIFKRSGYRTVEARIRLIERGR